MIRLLAFSLGIFLIFLPFVKNAIADTLTMDDNTEHKQKLNQGTKEEKSIAELLGPKDNFPFLPDNHRDSGTGKFNSF